MFIPRVDLSPISMRSEVVLRGGNVKAPGVRRQLRDAYARLDDMYPDIRGLSVVFRPGATLDELARAASFPHSKLSHARVTELNTALSTAGFAVILFVTPHPEANLPDHHTLAVEQGGVIQLALDAAAAYALIQTMRVVDNAYQTLP